eukprot:TRINITY_DN10642_c0_g1_i2.p1 TRINITY_DN10642_c0_g1~~TRINITY_DN10642_c0_g1_i2.p1  ORF type:complete len:419 (+),score=115.17 TRINITY_DN10642_c0_g1_i2:57-1259(+)
MTARSEYADVRSAEQALARLSLAEDSPEGQWELEDGGSISISGTRQVTLALAGHTACGSGRQCERDADAEGAPEGFRAVWHRLMRVDLGSGMVLWLLHASRDSLHVVLVDLDAAPADLTAGQAHPTALSFRDANTGADVRIWGEADSLRYTVSGEDRPAVRLVRYDGTDSLHFPQLRRSVRLPADAIVDTLRAFRAAAELAGVSHNIPASLPHGALRRRSAARVVAPSSRQAAMRPLLPVATCPEPPMQRRRPDPEAPPPAKEPTEEERAQAVAAAVGVLKPLRVTAENLPRRRAAVMATAESLMRSGRQEEAENVLCAVAVLSGHRKRVGEPADPEQRPDESECRRRVYATKVPPRDVRCVRALSAAESAAVEQRIRIRQQQAQAGRGAARGALASQRI